MSDGDGPLFIDNNVLVDAFDETAGSKHEQARSLLDRIWSENRGALSVQVLQEFYVVITQKVPRPLQAALASEGLWSEDLASGENYDGVMVLNPLGS